MIRKHSANVDIRQYITGAGAGHAKKTAAHASTSGTLPDSSDRLPTLNIYSVIVECPSNTCDFRTGVYSMADLDMWNDEGLLYPECPMCGNIIQKAKEQYREIEL